MTRKPKDLRAEIQERLGFFPPFFAPALSDAPLLEKMWAQTVTYYLEGPLPLIFKERLATLLARDCNARYCLMCHCCTLRPLGMTGEQVVELLRQSFLELRQPPLATLAAAPELVEPFPETGSVLEDALLQVSLQLAADKHDAEAHAQLKRVLGRESYHYLMLFIDYCKMCAEWVTKHPEISFADDFRVQQELTSLLQAAPSLRQLLAERGAQPS